MSIILGRVSTPLGMMVVGIAEDSCVVLDFEDRRSLERLIAEREQIYGATERGNHELMERIQTQLKEYFAGVREDFDIPISLVGSSFTKEVWHQLQQIPYGKTRSYGEVARALGRPGASRAVGRANGENCIAIIIPCHRVIGADGSLVGYGGGKKRKESLLDLESNSKYQKPLDDYFSIQS